MRAALIFIIILLAVVLSIGVAGRFVQPRAQQQQSAKTGTLVSFSGSNEKSSTSFTVPEGCNKFTVHWKARGNGREINQLQVIAVNENTGREEYIVSADRFGQVAEGLNAKPLRAGPYYLRTYVVNNSWEVKAGCE